MILKTLQNKVLPKIVQPHLMDVPAGQPYTTKQIMALQKLKPVNKLVDALLDALIARGYGQAEQETLLPHSPV